MLALAMHEMTLASMFTDFESVLPRNANLSTASRILYLTVLLGLIRLQRGWLMHDLGFFGANCKPGVVASSRKAANALLHHGFSGSIKRTVICEQVTHCSLFDLGLFLKPTQVEEFPISSVTIAKTVSIVVVKGTRQHGCGHHAEQCRCKDTALLNTVRDRECLGRVHYLVLGRACHRGIDAP